MDEIACVDSGASSRIPDEVQLNHYEEHVKFSSCERGMIKY